ncbi:hypothetical protein Q8A73_020362 [Channa argus]|nr:hypothetical protein Q8A73_020362 [Channa argus]
MAHNNTCAMSSIIVHLKAELHAAKENEKRLIGENKMLREKLSKCHQAKTFWEEEAEFEQTQNRKYSTVLENLENVVKETKLQLKSEQEMRQHDQTTSSAYQNLQDNLHDKRVKYMMESRNRYKDRVKTLTEQVKTLSQQVNNKDKEHENTKRVLNAKIRHMDIMISELIHCKLMVQAREQADTTDKYKKEVEAKNMNELNKDKKYTKTSEGLKHLETRKKKEEEITQRETRALKLELEIQREELGNVFKFIQDVEKKMNNYCANEVKLQNVSHSASASRDSQSADTDRLAPCNGRDGKVAHAIHKTQDAFDPPV